MINGGVLSAETLRKRIENTIKKLEDEKDKKIRTTLSVRKRLNLQRLEKITKKN